MQNAAFAARGLDWAYVPLLVEDGRVEDAVRGLVALGFAGANVTAPHKADGRAARRRRELDSVNTLVVRDGRVEGHSTDTAILDGLARRAAGDRRRRRRGGGVPGSAAGRARLLPARRLAPGRGRRRPGRPRHVRCGTRSSSPCREGQTLIDLPYPETATGAGRARGRRDA